MRVGIAGGPGIGKTTLATALSAATGLSLVAEGVRPWLELRGITQPRALEYADAIALQLFFLRTKMRCERALDGFISDRTIIDGVVITRERISEPNREIEACTIDALTYAQSGYDLIVIPPLVNYGDFDPVRPPRGEDRAREHRHIEQLVMELGHEPLQLDRCDVPAWTETVLRKIRTSTICCLER